MAKNPSVFNVPSSIKHQAPHYWFDQVKFEPFALSLSKGFDKLSLNGS